MSRHLSKDESRKRYAEGRQLWNEFDPIGVYGIDSEGPKDEYDGYVGPTLRLCVEGKSSDEMQSYVESAVYGHMGLSRTPASDESIASFVSKFRKWYSVNWPDSVV